MPSLSSNSKVRSPTLRHGTNLSPRHAPPRRGRRLVRVLHRRVPRAARFRGSERSRPRLRPGPPGCPALGGRRHGPRPHGTADARRPGSRRRGGALRAASRDLRLDGLVDDRGTAGSVPSRRRPRRREREPLGPGGPAQGMPRGTPVTSRVLAGGRGIRPSPGLTAGSEEAAESASAGEGGERCGALRARAAIPRPHGSLRPVHVGPHERGDAAPEDADHPAARVWRPRPRPRLRDRVVLPGRASPSAIFRDSYFPRSVSHCFRWKVENRSASSATASTFSIYAS